MRSRSEWAARLDALGSDLRRTHALPIGQKGLGVPESDLELWRIGNEWLAARQITAGARAPGPDVYVATNLYRSGGHSLLIGDFVRALSNDADHAEPPRLIVTNTSNAASTVDEDAQARTGISAGATIVLRGPSIIDRLDQLFEALIELRPRRLFLFQHPDDPLPVVVARPETSAQRVLVHHADARLSFGLHLPGVQLIDLNPIAVATSRLQGLAPALLRLTCADPGPRPGGFLRRDRLVTATSAAPSKITRPHFYSYPETVAVILRATGGWHVHIGELDQPTLTKIRAELHRAGVAEDRFAHEPWVPSVATTLWEHHCDVYVSSFPIDGARTNVEVMASATPHLRYAAQPNADVAEIGLAGGLVWHTWEELERVLKGLAHCELLEERSRLIRAGYESRHHQHVFQACLRQILAGGPGAIDPRQDDLDRRAVRSLAHATAATAMRSAQRAEGDSTGARLARWLLRR